MRSYHHPFPGCFNPRSHEGSDPEFDGLFVVSQVSIHAPTKGATSSIPSVKPSLKFQSTLPRRERLHLSAKYFYSRSFNPRSHEGSDAMGIISSGSATLVSIHAPTKGATYWPLRYLQGRTEFQSTLPRRERRYCNAH